MYSMVLLAALTTATDTPDFGRRGGCCGCHGGWGGWGGCYGCYGGCYGCYGWGGWGGGWGGWGGGYGGWGGWGGWGYAYAPVASSYASPVMLASNSIPATTIGTRSMYYSPTTANNRATIIVHVPNDAKLMIDGHQTTSVSSTRRLYSPPLQPGKSYHYNLEAMVTRDGKPIKVEKRVDVRAGVTREVTITMPERDQQTKGEQAPPAPAERKGLSERRVGLNSH